MSEEKIGKPAPLRWWDTYTGFLVAFFGLLGTMFLLIYVASILKGTS
ncbi:protein of unknown function (plasmid) [Cupriavidus taiwanensis]|uniref:Uncharacterized protein n=1 Tax=Cupriavidus taiwanensis TaxID=164546 RepID=A0A375I9B8_9BURK|nr:MULTISPECIES: hypothetical protein [Burkholderiaceae]SDP81803.1 hypothetical protein SAMN04488595_1294 [Ralstonia sp. 25mfcol4.1]SPK70089.1 hypothetical protein CT19425_U350059 [Cupriavidus taiwanensis]SPK74895.1 protein of unknown function [Cupriavidus taiwanensis]